MPSVLGAPPQVVSPLAAGVICPALTLTGDHGLASVRHRHQRPVIDAPRPSVSLCRWPNGTANRLEIVPKLHSGTRSLAGVANTA